MRNYAGYTQLIYPIELFYYAQKSGNAQPEATIFETYQSFNLSGLYNAKIYQDVFLNYDNAGWSNLWNTDGFHEYLRYVTVNFGLNGLYYYATPRDYIEGYTDPLLQTLADLPVYEGGDQCTSPFLAIDNPPTHPPNNPMAFFTGEDDHSLTRTYGLWLNETTIKVNANDYYSIS